MKLYIVERTDNVGYDELRSAAVLAETEVEAINFVMMANDEHGDWEPDRNNLKAYEIDITVAGVVLVDFREA